MKRLKVLTVVGTRPEIIRLAAVMRRLDATEGIEHVLVHTGQNWDRQLNGVFFDDLGLRLPDHVLDVDVSSLGATLGDILRKTEADLGAMGYPVRRWPMNYHFAGVHAIRIDGRVLDGGADPGRDGMALRV